MKPLAFHCLAVALLLCPGFLAWAEESADNEEALGLPRWSDQELEVMRRGDPGGIAAVPLWPGGMASLPGMKPGQLLADGSGPQADSPDAEQPHTDVSHFLPPALIIGQQNSHPAATAQRPQDRIVREVPASFLREAESMPPGQYLIDPLHQLPEVVRDDLGRFLDSHARDARVSLYVLVLPTDQKLPASINLAKMAQGSLLRKDSCLAVYPMGEPWRLRLFMSRSIRDQVPTAELGQVMDDAIRGAMQTVDSEEQLHRLLIRLSIRLFWLEPSLASSAPLVETIAKAIPAQPESSTLLEITSTESAKPAPSSWSAYTWTAVSFLMLTLGWFLVQRWQRYKLRHYEWILPEPPVVTPRFDCPHGATVAMIHYQ